MVSMETLYYIVVLTVHLILTALQLLMLVRAILSFLPLDGGAISAFLNTVTEPVIYPMRRITERFGIGEGLPIDIPFFLTFILLSVLSAIL